MTYAQQPLPLFDSGLARVLSSLCFDDALVVDCYRVEFWKYTGRPEIRVFRRKRLVWTIKVSMSRLPELIYGVAFWLAQRGCEGKRARRVEYGAVA